MGPTSSSTTFGIAAALLVAAALLAGGAAPAAAQSDEAPPPRSGFWLAGGLGGGFDEEGEAGGAGYLRLGGTPNRHWLLGFEGIGFTRDAGDDATVSHGNATFVALHYPSVTSGWFLKGGVGFATAEIEQDVDPGTLTIDDEGVGLTLGTGLDLQIGGNLFLTPGFDVLLQSFDGLESVESAYLLTLGIGFH